VGRGHASLLTNADTGHFKPFGGIGCFDVSMGGTILLYLYTSLSPCLDYISGRPMSLKALGCQASKMANSDTCPRPTTGPFSVWRPYLLLFSAGLYGGFYERLYNKVLPSAPRQTAKIVSTTSSDCGITIT
jgi:hypothetical protein